VYLVAFIIFFLPLAPFSFFRPILLRDNSLEQNKQKLDTLEIRVYNVNFVCICNGYNLIYISQENHLSPMNDPWFSELYV
jgi:hypothetical protein